MITFTAMKSIPWRVQALATVSLALGAVVLVAAAPARASEVFGIEKLENVVAVNEGGEPAVQAGSHPYQMTTTFLLNRHKGPEEIVPDGDLRNLEVNLPPGLIGNPAATAVKCTEAELEDRGHCPNASAVGITAIRFSGVGTTVAYEPVYNMIPPHGEPS